MRPSSGIDIIVIGAGMAGVSVAAELSQSRSVLLLDQESQPGYHATGRSAAILAQTYGGDVVQALTRASDDVLTHPPQGFSDQPLLTPRGLVLVARADQADALRAQVPGGSGYLEWIEADRIESLIPILRKGYAVGGVLNSAAQDIDVHAMLQGYLRQFRQRGGQIRTRAPVTALRRTGAMWEVDAGGACYQAGMIVNAAGAWADEVAALAGLPQIGLRPLRRSALTFRPPEGFDPASLPMVVDADERFYLKPEAGMLLASPANETPSAPCDSQPEEIEVAEALDRIMTAFDLDVRRVEAKWSGLRTFTPDRAPLCGFDAEAETFFWLAGQGGYGIQTAPALAQMAAHLITCAPLGPGFAAAELDPNRLSPKRFLDGMNKTP